MMNLAEYATGTEPLNATSLARPVIVPSTTFAISFRRATTPADVRCTIQVSNNFLTWQDASTYAAASSTGSTALTAEVSRTAAGAGLETIVVRTVAAPTAAKPRRYLRLKVTKI